MKVPGSDPCCPTSDVTTVRNYRTSKHCQTTVVLLTASVRAGRSRFDACMFAAGPLRWSLPRIGEARSIGSEETSSRDLSVLAPRMVIMYSQLHGSLLMSVFRLCSCPFLRQQLILVLHNGELHRESGVLYPEWHFYAGM